MGRGALTLEQKRFFMGETIHLKQEGALFLRDLFQSLHVC